MAKVVFTMILWPCFFVLLQNQSTSALAKESLKNKKAEESDEEEVTVRPKKGDHLEVKTVSAKRR